MKLSIGAAASPEIQHIHSTRMMVQTDRQSMKPSNQNIFLTEDHTEGRTPKNSDRKSYPRPDSIDFNYPMSNTPVLNLSNLQNLSSRIHEQEEATTTRRDLSTHRRTSRSRSGRKSSRSKFQNTQKRITKAEYLQRKIVFDIEKEEELILDPIVYFQNHKLKHFEIPKHCKPLNVLQK